MTDDDDDDDRRRAERVPINEEFGRLPEATYISDLSEFGLFVQTRFPPQLGTMVSLRFTVLLEDPFVLQAHGRVVRHSRDPRGMGIEFTEMSPETVLRINDVVAMQQSEGADAPSTSADTLDGAQTHVRGQIPIGPDALEVRSQGTARVEESDDGTTSRFPAVGASATTSGAQILATGEYEVLPDDVEDEP